MSILILIFIYGLSAYFFVFKLTRPNITTALLCTIIFKFFNFYLDLFYNIDFKEVFRSLNILEKLYYSVVHTQFEFSWVVLGVGHTLLTSFILVWINDSSITLLVFVEQFSYFKWLLTTYLKTYRKNWILLIQLTNRGYI